MANSPDVDADDDFSELYKEYTGPPRSTTVVPQEKTNTNKRSHAGSDEEDEPRDPNAVPTDFTSREAKVWEAKSKATERNWKKRKEEEMICKRCGESGHFTQGCPSTLGSSRKSQDFFERVPARDKHVRAIFTDRVIQKIEKDVGCKIKMDEKFIIVSGKDRLILLKGLDAVNKLIKEDGDQKGSSSSHMSRSRSPDRSPAGSRSQRSDVHRSHSGPTNASQFQPRFSRQEKVVENRARDDLQKYPRSSVQAYGNDRVRGRSSHSKSPAHPPYSGSSFGSYDSYQNKNAYGRTEGWDNERRGSDLQSSRQFEYPAFPQSLEELEIEYKREATELGKIRDKEEDEENYKNRETIREMRESYTKKLTHLRGTHAKQWDEFLQLDAQRRQQQVHQQMAASGFVGASSASERSRALRALQLYMQFHVHRSTVLRTVLVTANFRSRFHLSLQLLDLSGAKPTLRLSLPVPLSELCPQFFGAGAAASSPTTGGKGGYRKVRREFSFGAQHIASPPEIERLCDTTIRVTDEALLLPGVEGDDSLAGPLLQAKALAQVQRQLYSAEGWLVVARASEKDNKDGTEGRSAARGCVQQAVALAKAGGFPEADLYAAYSEALQASLAAQDLALNAPSSSTAAYTASSSRSVLLRTVGAANIPANATYVAELPTAFVPQSGFARVPPGFQSMPAKPAFVDIAATYLELPGDDAPAAPAAPTQRAAAAPPTPAATKAGSAEPSPAASAALEETKKPEEKKKGWGFGSLWGR